MTELHVEPAYADEELDLPPLGEFVAELSQAGAAMEAGFHIDGLEVDLPVELELYGDGDHMTLSAGPPMQRTATTVMPVFHRLRISIEASENGIFDS
jgi:hypothetical protein